MQAKRAMERARPGARTNGNADDRAQPWAWCVLATASANLFSSLTTGLYSTRGMGGSRNRLSDLDPFPNWNWEISRRGSTFNPPAGRSNDKWQMASSKWLPRACLPDSFRRLGHPLRRRLGFAGRGATWWGSRRARCRSRWSITPTVDQQPPNQTSCFIECPFCPCSSPPPAHAELDRVRRPVDPKFLFRQYSPKYRKGPTRVVIGGHQQRRMCIDSIHVFADLGSFFQRRIRGNGQDVCCTSQGRRQRADKLLRQPRLAPAIEPPI